MADKRGYSARAAEAQERTFRLLQLVYEDAARQEEKEWENRKDERRRVYDGGVESATLGVLRGRAQKPAVRRHIGALSR
jgi:hypothetical protein